MTPEELNKILDNHLKILESQNFDNNQLEKLIEEIDSIDLNSINITSKEEILLLNKKIEKVIELINKLKKNTLDNIKSLENKKEAEIKYLRNQK